MRLHILVALLVTAGCASGIDQLEGTGCGDLAQLRDTGHTRICITKDLPQAEYSGAMLVRVRTAAQPVGSSSTSLVGRPAGTRYQVGPQQKTELERMAEDAFESALADLAMTRTSEGGAGVLSVRGEFLDLIFETPTDTDSGAKYLLDRTGRGTLVVELRDSASNTLLLWAFDERSTGIASADADAELLQQLADQWGEMLLESVGYLRSQAD
jgi:hypothetical protein